MADQDGDPEVDLDPPVENGDEDVEQQDQQVEEQDEEPEGDDVDASPPEQDRQEPPEPQPSRGDRRIQTLSNELKLEREQRSELNRRLDALLAGQNNRPPQGETPEARAQRMALLTPEERIREELTTATQTFAREQQALRFQITDGNDRAAFEAKATVDQLYAKWKPKVEAELQTLRQQGMNVERERLMYYLIGKNAVEARGKVKGQQRAEAARNVRRQQTRPSNSGSDVAANRRGNGSASLERRLENQAL